MKIVKWHVIETAIAYTIAGYFVARTIIGLIFNL